MTNVILVSIYIFIACIALLVIMRIRSRNVFTGSALENTQNEDFIDKISNFRRKQLSAKPWNMKYETYIAIGTVCSIVFAVTGFLYGGVTYAVIAAVIGQLVPELIVRIQASAQQRRFEERYARSLRQLSACLKSGMSLPQAIEDVCQSPFVHDDVRKEFKQLSAELKLGIPIKEAFDNFYKRVQFSDAADVAIAIGMQANVGGREGAVIETIAKNIGDRMMLRKEIGSMFAGSNVTVTVLDILPFGVVGFLFIGASDFMKIYFSSMGMLALLIGLLVFMGIGSVITHNLITRMRRECGVEEK